jgi:hypothetical protein
MHADAWAVLERNLIRCWRVSYRFCMRWLRAHVDYFRRRTVRYFLSSRARGKRRTRRFARAYRIAMGSVVTEVKCWLNFACHLDYDICDLYYTHLLEYTSFDIENRPN